MLANGGWVVTWRGEGPGDSDGIFQQVYTDTGAKYAFETRVNATISGLHRP